MENQHEKNYILKVLAYPASAYILLNAASQPVLAQMQEEPVPETQVEKNEILSEEIEPSETVDTEVDQTVIEPEIDADDVWLEVGDEWDPWEDVTAYDRQDGNITDKVEIISVKKREEKPKLMKMARIPVEIDTSEPDIYDLVYRIVDRFGGETIKAIVVTITEKAPEKQEISYPNPTVTNTSMPTSTRGVPTGVHHDMMGYASMLVTSLGALMGINAFKRRHK